MELRDIEIFLTLAEELHFGRTAQQLLVSQARISQAIAKQEREIGGALFDRSNRRSVRLTRLGEQFRNDLHPVYAGLKESVERARLVAQGKTDVLRIGIIASNANDLRPFWETFRTRHPRWGLQLRHNSFIDPFAPLRSGQIDVLISWLPVEEPDLTVGPVIWTEPQVLMVAADHKLADRASLSLEVLGDDHRLLKAPAGLEPPRYWEDAFAPFYTPGGRPILRGAAVATNLDEMLTVISSGEAVHPIFAHGARYHARPGIAFVPVHDGRPGRWALVWRTGAETELTCALVQVVRDLGPGSITPEAGGR